METDKETMLLPLLNTELSFHTVTQSAGVCVISVPRYYFGKIDSIAEVKTLYEVISQFLY